MENGDVLAGRYRLEELLREDPEGTFYRATDLALNRLVFLMVAPADDRDFVKRVRQMALSGKTVAHRAVNRVLGAGSHQGHPFLVTELIRGRALNRWFHATGRDWERLAHVLEEVLDALEHAHSRGVVHGDLRPDRLRVDADGDRPHLLGFGLRRRDEEPEAAAFASPEEASGGPATPASDMYSLGAALFVAVSGKPLFAGRSAAGVLLARLEEDPPPLHSVCADCPAWLDSLVGQLLARSAADRPTAAEALQLLRSRDLAAELPALAAPGEAPLLDRRAELDALLAAAGSGRGGAIRLEGAAGAGKSRLLDELSSRARVVRVRPTPEGLLHPGLVYEAVGELEALRARLAEGPLVLSVEHLERADGPLLDLLDRLLLMARRLPLFLVLSYRPEELDRPAEARLRTAVPAVVELPGLTREGAARLMRHLAGWEPTGDAARWVHELTEGNPFFVEELAADLAGRGLPGSRGAAPAGSTGAEDAPAAVRGPWTPPPGAPESLDELLRRRLSRVGEPAATALAAAACLGSPFSADLVRRLTGATVAETRERLDELAERKLVEPCSGDQYAFAHRRVWELAQDRLGDARRRRMHLLAAAALEREDPPRCDAVAWHYEQSGHPSEAVLGYLRAAHAQRELGHRAGARYFLDRAAKAARTGDADLLLERVEEELADLGT